MIEITRDVNHAGRFQLSTEAVVPAAVDDVFSFFADAANLQVLTPPWLRFQILTELPIDMHAGTLIDYRLALRGIPVRWQTEISVWDPPFRFVDRQVRGPYRIWEHTHTFEEVPDGTLMRDSVSYAVPGGAVVNALFVAPELKRIFEFRRQQLLGTVFDKCHNDAVT